MIDEDYFDDDQPVIRIAQNQKTKAQFEKNILKQAQQYLDDISEDEHQFLIQTLRDMAQEEKYFDVLADQLDQPVDAKVANDALNLLYFWQLIHEAKEISEFNLLDVINTEFFQSSLLDAFELLDIGESKAQYKAVLAQSFKLYELELYAGCIPLLYAQLEGLLTAVLLQNGYLKQQDTKFIDVYKIVPGLKGHEIKSLWHKVKIANELNHYFLELAAYKMDNSSTVSMTRHNILHGTELSHFNQGRSFVLFIWLFSAVSFMSSLKS
ncbi:MULTISPECIES: hypothetical protein [Acinetobacter]|uniref:DUF4209 domain-containing protein n=1 Tax=Acinetobacter bereziniae NIPH 3 TaxID=1217651 RepID=N8XG67_ACIBZ|nr:MULTISPECIES: hypothetical protein [Acinetobacter]ELW77999.1 hypothetical protein ACINWC743_0689 [Acinetobacter sp. WC-743]ENV23507.1 hypothetical protein F963_00233 [Acinetobacter bereziniae NIPH 3]MBI0397032.1 hypothetical protein [Acinetobacter bereziniae]MBJ8428708.1 hypothetical protein [Acinetobacter bereziniae]MBJ8477672.1 hypothetical protein [Acinetobacter bereziniae]